MTSEDNKRLYHVWAGMKSRCDNPNVASARWYHDKGIRVCKEWHESFITFRTWAEANGYKEGLTIDRIDSDGNYEPGNCQWLTRSENSRKASRLPRKRYTAKQSIEEIIARAKMHGISEENARLLIHIAESLNSLDAHSAAIAAARIDGFADGIRTAQIMQRDKEDRGNRR